MTEREKDVVIARAMGLNIQPFVYFWDGKNLDWHQATPEDLKDPHWTVTEYIKSEKGLKVLHDYGTPEGSWQILDYVRKNLDSDFSERFLHQMTPALCIGQRDCYPDECVRSIFANLTPSLVKEAAYLAAKE